MRQYKHRNPKRLFIEPLEAREVPAKIIVTTTADVVDSADHKVSLREAISKANSDSGPQPDTILLPEALASAAK